MIYVIRHGEKEKGDFFNARLRHQDQPLSRHGRAQARALERRFRRTPVSEIIVSEYIRTGQTIAPLARRLGLTPTVDPRLNEIDIGAIDGLSDQEIALRYPDTWKAYVGGSADFRWPDGETGEEAGRRIMSLFSEKADPGKNLILVAHDGIIRILICKILGVPVYRRFLLRMGTAGVNELDWDKETKTWHLARMNQTP